MPCFQRAVEKSCLRIFEMMARHDINFKDEYSFRWEQTANFLKKGLKNLTGSYECLDASRPWLAYWILHSLELMNILIQGEQRLELISFLAKCQNPGGGFGGGPGQMSHLAPTYAAINALSILGGAEAYNVIDREALVRWLDSLRLDDGSYLMHEDGEVDIRGVYCALSAAHLTNVYSPELFRNTGNWVLRCQTYEGGFGGAPGMEAHGGYSFCGLAALMFMNKGELCDTDRLLSWAANRQMRLEGGFQVKSNIFDPKSENWNFMIQGRTNKLVDGCYSFWQGGIFPLLNDLIDVPPRETWLFDCEALQEYLLLCCQDQRGGLIDKPGKGRDFYHTCYCLSGLSVAQHMPDSSQAVLGSSNNRVVSRIRFL